MGGLASSKALSSRAHCKFWASSPGSPPPSRLGSELVCEPRSSRLFWDVILGGLASIAQRADGRVACFRGGSPRELAACLLSFVPQSTTMAHCNFLAFSGNLVVLLSARYQLVCTRKTSNSKKNHLSEKTAPRSSAVRDLRRRSKPLC